MGEREDFEAAERLVREAHARAQAAAQEVPPNGWATPGAPPPSSQIDFNALFGLVEALKGTVPPELARQLADALRELLIAIRAILDYSIDRLDTTQAPEPQVEDIPIQ